MNTEWFAVMCFVMVTMVMLFFICLAYFSSEKGEAAKAAEADNNEREILSEMLNDTGFAKWADDYGLTYSERQVAWDAWKMSRKDAGPQNEVLRG